MVLSVFALFFVLGITFMHSIFGLFSGLIDLLCCLSAMAVAFGFADTLNEFVAGQELNPSYTLPVCFVALFVITHLVLRLAADNLMRGNVRVPQYVDWAGGAVCGFLIAQVSVGVLVIGFLLLPWGGRVMMFQRYERLTGPDALDPATHLVRTEEHHVGFFLRPDEFTIGLFNLLSNGSLRGGTTFATVYPDYAQWIAWTGNTVQTESLTAPIRDKSGDGFGDKAFTVESWWVEKEPVQAIYRSVQPTRQNAWDDLTNPKVWSTVDYPERGSDKHMFGVRLRLGTASADRDKESAFHRFRPTMIRLVGSVNGKPREYCARILGGAHPGTDELRLVDIDNNFALNASGDIEMDAYFEVDPGFEPVLKTDSGEQPGFVEYRRFARAPLRADERVAAAPAEHLIAPFAAAGENSYSGAMRFLGAIMKDGTGDTANLPFGMSPTALQGASDVEMSGGKFKSGRLTGFVETLQGAGPVGSVREIAVPEGKRLFQLQCNPRKAYTLAGNVFNFVAAVANNYLAKDDNAGKEYPLAGYYAIVKRDGKDFIELYIPNDTEKAAFRGMLDFKNIDRNQELRKNDSVLGLLFFVDPGAKISGVSNQTGQGVQFSPAYQIGR